MAIHHLDRKGNKLEKSIKCPKCDFTCYARFQLIGHMGLKMHNCARTFKCDKCNHTTHTRKEHEQHVRQHDDNGRSLAEMVSNNETSLNNTEEPEECSETGNKKSSARWERSSKRSFGCEYCPRWFKSQQELSRHVMGVHHLDSKGNQLEKTIKCSECDFTCYAMFQLQRHTAVTHRKNGPAVKKSRILKCDKCDFVCSSKVLLSRHLETVHSDGLFKSDQANLCVLTDVDLAKDSTRDNAVANEDNCVSENAPEQMQRTTPGIICSKTGRKKLGVRWETRIKGSFRCEHCNRGFKCDKDLFRHVVTIHHLGSQGGKLEKTIKCSKCDFTCHTRFQLKRHMRLNKNTRSHMVKCDKCDFVCRTEDMLSDHLETFHTDGIFECNICDHISHTRNELDQHVEQHIDNRSSCDLEEIVSNDESPLKDSVTEDQEHSATERARSLFVAALTRNSNVAINTITLTDDSISSRADKDKENEYVEDENDAEKEVVNDAKNDNDEKDSDNEEFEGDEKSSSSQTRDYEMEEDHEKIEDNIQDEGHLLRSGTLTFEEQTSNLEPISRSNPVSSESADEETSTTMEIVNGNENGDSSEKDLSDATISAQVEDGKITETVSSMDFICKRCTYSCDFNFALNRLLSSVHDSDTQLNKSEVNIKCPRCSYICYAMERVNSSETEVHISEASVLNCSQCDFLCFSSKELSRHQSRRHPPKWIGERWGAEVKGLSSSEIGKRAEVKGLSSSKIGKRDQRYRCHVCSKTYKYKACLVMHMEKMHQQPFANVVPSTDIVASTAINEAMSVSQDPEPSVIVLPCNLPSLIPESTVTTFSVANLVTTMDNSEDGLLNDHDYCSKLSPIYCSDSSIETGVDAAVELRVSSAEMIEANPSSFYSVLTLESLGDCLGIDSAEVPGEAAPKDMEDKDVCPDRLHQSCSSSENVTAVKTIEETDSTTCEKIEKIFQCKHCSYTSADRRYLIIHVMSKHEMDIEGNKLERSVKCPKCEFSCVKQFQLRRHDLAVHGGQIKCDKCSHTCSSEAEMIRHQGTFHDNYKPFKCDTCGFSCETRNSLDQHSTKHNSSKTSRFKRPKWGANLNGQVQLLRHMPNGGEQHSCNRCHRNFGSRYNLECHKKKSHRSDSDNKSAGPFTCDWCGRVSKNISSHDRHLKIFGHGRFMCEVCGVVVRHSITIDRHVKDQHTPGSEPQVCGVCHTACDTKWDLHLHMNKEHGVELPKFIRDGSRKKDGPPFNCDKCDYTTPNYRLYRKHEKWHNEPKRICQLCGKALKGLRALKRHMKRHENNALNK